MVLSKKRLEQEIAHTKGTIEKLKQIDRDSITGVELNLVILLALEDALLRSS